MAVADLRSLAEALGTNNIMRSLRLQHHAFAVPYLEHIKYFLTTLGGLSCTLTLMDFTHNSLTHLPEEIGLLTSLTHLDVSHNQARPLPSVRCHLKALSSFIRIAHSNI
tara:strand:- start:3756 stop:4082 length:327 start_codon:yes stop_codon:yes gene_type:complete